MPIKALTFSQMKHKTATRRPDNRPSAASRGYGYRWVKLRDWFIKKYPLCVECLKEGVATAWTTAIIKGKLKRFSNEVDHIIPHKGDNKLKYDSDNLQTLCKPHHSTKTATEDGGFGHKIKETI